MVPFNDGNRTEHIMESTQRDSMDEDQAVSLEKSIPLLYYLRDSSPTVLGPRDVCEFHLLQ